MFTKNFFWLILANLFFVSYGHDNAIVLVDDEIDIFYIKANSGLNITFKNIEVLSVKCSGGKFYGISTVEILTNSTSEIKDTYKISRINSAMFGSWNCSVQSKNSTKYLNYYLIVKDLSSDTQKVKVKISGVTQDFESNVTYQYYDGELIDWSCNKKKKNERLLHLKYYNAKGKLEVASNVINEHEGVARFRQLMTAQSNYFYLDCIYSGYIDNDFKNLIYRTTFIMRNEIDNIGDGITIKINDIKLVPIPQLSGTIYRYKFLRGETLNITCESNKDHGLSVDTDIEYARGITWDNSKNGLVINTKSLTNKSSIKYYVHEQEKTYKLYLYEDYDVAHFVLGLRAKDILYQYTEDNRNWHINYQYILNEDLNLTCSTNIPYRTVVWSNVTADNGAAMKIDLNETGILKFTVTNNAILVCKSALKNVYDYNIRIYLIEKPGFVFVADKVNMYSNVHILYIAITVFLVLIITAYTVYWYRKHKTKATPFANFHNEVTLTSNFPNQMESNEYTYIRNSTAFPNEIEGNEYAYIRNSFSIKYGVSVANTLYADNLSLYKAKAPSDYTENHYSEIDDIHPENRDKQLPSKLVLYENQVAKNKVSDDTNYVNKESVTLKENEDVNSKNNYSNETKDDHKDYANI